MRKQIIIRIAAPLGVAVGLTLFFCGCILLCRWLGISQIFQLLHFMPEFVIIMVGAANLGTFLSVFIIGFIKLGNKRASGFVNNLETRGLYRYLRNPMYAGISFSIFGLGLLINNTAVALTGLLWLVVCYFQCKREEKELENKFGNVYLDYKSRTPMFIPDFKLLIFDLLGIHHPKKIAKTKTKY